MLVLKRTALAVTLLMWIAATGAAAAATPADFYLDLLQKGIAGYNAAQYGEAVGVLRVAAFGLLDATSHYQTAQVYRALAADKLNDPATARDAAQRVLAAERVQRTYASLPLPAAIRSSFESVAKKTLAPSEMSVLTGGAAPAQTPQQQPQAAVRTTPTETKPAPAQSKPAASTQPQKETPPRAKTTPPPQQVEKEPKPAPVPAPATKTTETPKVEPPKSEPAKVETTKAEPPKVEPPKVDPPKSEPPPKPAVATPAPAPAAPRDLTQTLAAGERALATGNLAEARRIYRTLLDGPLTHEQALRVAEGAYRARDFPLVLRAFERAGALRRGEEPYHFYLAVALYETGRYSAAKKELAAALNFIEVTPDVARYREKIESAAD